MSKELDELRRLAALERRRAWSHTKLIPGRIGDTAGAFAKTHPILAMASAAAITMKLLSRRRRRNGVEGKTQSWQLALAAMAVQVLPDILHTIGLTVPQEKESSDESTPECAPGADPAPVFANSSERSGTATANGSVAHSS